MSKFKKYEKKIIKQSKIIINKMHKIKFIRKIQTIHIFHFILIL